MVVPKTTLSYMSHSPRPMITNPSLKYLCLYLSPNSTVWSRAPLHTRFPSPSVPVSVCNVHRGITRQSCVSNASVNMEKEPQPDSLSEVTVKQYAPSEVYSSEPPPVSQKIFFDFILCTTNSKWLLLVVSSKVRKQWYFIRTILLLFWKNSSKSWIHIFLISLTNSKIYSNILVEWHFTANLHII